MANIQRADPAARRKVIIMVIIGAIVGALIITAFESKHLQLFDWLLSDHEKSTHRLRSLIILGAAFGAIPLLAFSVYLWSLGCRVSNYQRFPLPGQKVIRDTPIVEGIAALNRGGVFKNLAVFLAMAAFMLCYVFWWLILKLEELVA